MLEPAVAWDAQGRSFSDMDTLECDTNGNADPEQDPLEVKFDVGKVKQEPPDPHEGTLLHHDLSERLVDKFAGRTVVGVENEPFDIKHEETACDETSTQCVQLGDNIAVSFQEVLVENLQLNFTNASSLLSLTDPLTLKHEYSHGSVTEEDVKHALNGWLEDDAQLLVTPTTTHNVPELESSMTFLSPDIDLIIKFKLQPCFVQLQRLPVVVPSFKRIVRNRRKLPSTSPWDTNSLTDNTFSCVYCNKTFALKESIRQHVYSHVKPYQCEFCSYKCATNPLLRAHILRHLGEPIQRLKRHKCTICDKAYVAKVRLRNHLLTHSGKPNFSCLICHTSYIIEPTYKQHMQIHNKGFHCAICDKTCARKSEIRAHVQTHVGVYNFQCEICDKSFISKQGYTLHKGVHTKPFPCSICNKPFSNKLNLDHHMQKHLGTQPFKCETCNASFSKKCSYTRHIRSHTKPFECNLCGKRVSRQDHLALHVQTAHSNEQRIACAVCGKTFVTAQSYEGHMRIHTKPFECVTCKMSYSQKDSLEAHIMQCHSKNKRMHKCDICAKSFATALRLKFHTGRVHNLVSQTCTVCNKVLRSSLQEHMKTHEINRPKNFSCPVCEKSSYSLHDLKIHMKMHPLLLRCEICEKSFSYEQDLKNHILIYHF